MKKILTLTAMAVYTMVAVFFLLQSGASTTDNVQKIVQTEPATEPTEPEGYLVKTVNGVVAVEELKSGEIVKTTDTRAAILPAEDRRRLEQGIEAKDERGLRKILEDLCS